MKKPLSKFILLALSVIVFNVLSITVNAQENPVKKPFNGYIYLQPNLGLTQYYGDLNPDFYYNKNMKFGGGAILGYQISRVFGLRTQFFAGNLYGKSEAHQKELNTKIWDLTGQLTVNINEIFNNNPERKLNFYAFGGAGYVNLNSTVDNLDGTVFQTGKNDGRTFPIGAGAAYRLSKSIDLNLEYGQRVTSRDREMDFTTSGKKYDQYSYASAGVTIKFLQKDQDDDGIKDKEDLCPEAAGKIELAGCPDKDNDGIADKDDDCPDMAGKGEFKGCPDTDNDGVPDKDDACPTMAGRSELKGCPDKDGDGIADKDDKCPDVKGKKELGGCPDSDGDGVIDSEDVMPTVFGLAAFKGAPDTDKDGIPDNLDKCPDVAGVASTNGCPAELKGAVLEKIVYFDTDASVVLAKNIIDLKEIAAYMNENPDAVISVAGHADIRESDDYNMRLSERRADYVINYLKKKGMKNAKTEKSFFGKSRPVADNNTAEGRSLNRRVEIKITK